MDLKEYINKVWLYYLQLENDFFNTLNYVELTADNFSVYSKEYSKQLLSIGSEIDVVFKCLCREVSPDKKVKNITEYAQILCDYENIINESVKCKYIDGEFTPFHDWTATNSPEWWKDYNHVKHERTAKDNYKKGNLYNVFMALMALFVLNRCLCKCLSIGRVMKEPSDKSKLFEMIGRDSYNYVGNGFIQVLHSNGHMSLTHDNAFIYE